MLTNESLETLSSYLIGGDNVEPAIRRGKGAEVEDDDGKTYLDLEGGPGANSVGHAHPRLVDAIIRQAKEMFITPGRYHSRNTMTLAKRISEFTGDRLRRTFFTNSGAEAADGSIKLALKHAIAKGRKGLGIIALQHGFHGRLSLPLALTGMAKSKQSMGPYGTFPGVVHAPAPYCFRCPLGLTFPTCQTKCADAIEDMLTTSFGGEASILIAEPILGVGGVIVPPDDYWRKVEDICRRHGITLIYDEVFTGFGRTGKSFGHHHFDGKPDIMCFAKGIGSGVPLAGFIATEEVGKAFQPGDHSTTYGGKNQLGIAAGHAVMDIIKDEKLSERAAKSGEKFLEGLRALQKEFPAIGDARGRGLMLAVEFVTGSNNAPDAGLAKRVVKEMLQEGVLVSTTGVNANIVRITPALVISGDQINFALKAFRSALKRLTLS